MNSAATSRGIIALCQQHFPQYYNDCSGFVKAIATECGVLLSGNANDIVDTIQSNWMLVQDGISARDFARNGWLVVAGLKESGHGHVVVVVDGPMDRRGKYPYAFWGRYHQVSFGDISVNLGVLSRGHGNLNFAFGKNKRDKVIYAAMRVSGLLMPQLADGAGYVLHS